MVEDSQETTHFGLQTVAKEQKADMGGACIPFCRRKI